RLGGVPRCARSRAPHPSARRLSPPRRRVARPCPRLRWRGIVRDRQVGGRLCSWAVAPMIPELSLNRIRARRGAGRRVETVSAASAPLPSSTPEAEDSPPESPLLLLRPRVLSLGLG